MRNEPAARPVRHAAGTMRAARAAAEPPLDPPAVRSAPHGLPTWSVVPPAANSCVWLWPASTTPWPRSHRHTALSASATLPSSTRLDAVSPNPRTAKRSLSASGIPRAAAPRRPRRPAARRRRAPARATSGYRRTQRCGAGRPVERRLPPLRAAIRAWHASSSSTADSAPARRSAAASRSPRSAGSVGSITAGTLRGRDPRSRSSMNGAVGGVPNRVPAAVKRLGATMFAGSGARHAPRSRTAR